VRSIALAGSFMLVLAATALAEPRFATTAELLEAVRSGRVTEGAEVTLTRARISTRVTVEDSGPREYTTWFYVNDAGRDGDGVLVSLPHYWSAGSDPFDDDSEDPWESDIENPALKRGYTLEVSGRIVARDDGKGYMLDRPLGEWDAGDYLDLVVEGAGDDETHHVRPIKLKVLTSVEAPAPPRPSSVRATPSTVVAGEVVMVTGRDLGDRARLTLDGQPLEITTRRPGVLVATLPATTPPGAHTLRVSNPEVTGTSNAAALTVLSAAAPAAPELTSVERVGGLLLVKGRNLRGAGAVEALVGARKLTVLEGTATTLVLEAPATLAGALKVKLGGRESNSLPLPSATVGLTSLIPGS
jgi:hypothetical protein